MAGHVLLKAVAERILAAHAADPFGDFKVSPHPLAASTENIGHPLESD